MYSAPPGVVSAWKYLSCISTWGKAATQAHGKHGGCECKGTNRQSGWLRPRHQQPQLLQQCGACRHLPPVSPPPPAPPPARPLARPPVRHPPPAPAPWLACSTPCAHMHRLATWAATYDCCVLEGHCCLQGDVASAQLLGACRHRDHTYKPGQQTLDIVSKNSLRAAASDWPSACAGDSPAPYWTPGPLPCPCRTTGSPQPPRQPRPAWSRSHACRSRVVPCPLLTVPGLERIRGGAGLPRRRGWNERQVCDDGAEGGTIGVCVRHTCGHVCARNWPLREGGCLLPPAVPVPAALAQHQLPRAGAHSPASRMVSEALRPTSLTATGL